MKKNETQSDLIAPKVNWAQAKMHAELAAMTLKHPHDGPAEAVAIVHLQEALKALGVTGRANGGEAK